MKQLFGREFRKLQVPVASKKPANGAILIKFVKHVKTRKFVKTRKNSESPISNLASF